MTTIYNKDGLRAESDGSGVVVYLYDIARIEMTIKEFMAIAGVLKNDVRN